MHARVRIAGYYMYLAEYLVWLLTKSRNARPSDSKHLWLFQNDYIQFGWLNREVEARENENDICRFSNLIN